MPRIHPSALISEQARLADDVEIGPFCVIEGPVSLAEGVRLAGHNHLTGDVAVGPNTRLGPFAILGAPPQHAKIGPDDPVGGVRVGAGAVLREHVTVHAAMKPEAHTLVGDRCFLMVGVHVGHDAVVCDDVIICNGSMLAGHCHVGPGAYISGLCAVHQFGRVGRLAMMTGCVAASMDLPPGCVAVARNIMGGLNLVGMRRAGLDREEITLAKEAYRKAFRSGVQRQEQLEILDAYAGRAPFVADMAEFVRTAERPVMPGTGEPPPATTAWIRRSMRHRSDPPAELPSVDDDDNPTTEPEPSGP